MTYPPEAWSGPAEGADDDWRPANGRRAGEGPRQRGRRRRRRRITALLVLLLAGGLWWTSSDDPGADVRALGDPATYRDWAAKVGEVLDGVAVRPEVSVPTPVAMSPPPAASTVRATPPAGLDEEGARLLPAVVVAEESSAYAFAALQDDGVAPVAWSPCRPIRYVVNDHDAPEGFAAAVQEAAAELSAATGLLFVDDGSTTEEPSADRGAYLPEEYGNRWAPVLIAAAEPTAISFLDGDTAGVAYTYRVRGSASGTWHMVSGSVYLDREAFEFRAGADGDPGWTSVLRHELGHLVGLDHLDDPTQLMNPVTSSAVDTYQAGDRTGLALLGQGDCAPDV